jgi:uncharacterized protein YndB with AHSA1/START domain
MASGYTISASKTISASPARLFHAWMDDSDLRQWLAGAKFTIRKVTDRKLIRLDWDGGKSRVDVGFLPRGRNKTQMGVGHARLRDRKEAERMKLYWTKRLEQLKTLVEK